MLRRLREFVVVLVALSGCDTFVDGTEPRPTASRTDELRPDSPNTTEPPPSFAPGDVVEDYLVPDASVAVHFTRAGSHRVPAADTNDSGIPDFVESVGATYAAVLDSYEALGFRRPPDDSLIPGDNGGDSRFDVYLVNFGTSADGAYRKECLASDPIRCTGYMVQENDFAGFGYPTVLTGILTVSSHEYFHAVQAGYSSVQGINITEGTAVWASEQFRPALNDLEGFSNAYLMQPERSLDQEPAGPVDSYAYGLALFFECLTALRGQDAVKDLWERIDGGAGWLGTLERNVAEDGGSIATVLERCADYNLFTGGRARAGYGHSRAERLGLAMVTSSAGSLSVPRARMFRASSRYYQATGLPSDAVLWWRPADDAPDGGVASIRFRFTPGEPQQLQAVMPDTVVPVGATSAFVLITNVATGGPSVPVQVCVGAPSFVQGCRPAPDAGAPDAGMMMEEDAGVVTDGGVEPPPPPGSCGCGTGGAPLLLALGLMLVRRSRLRA